MSGELSATLRLTAEATTLLRFEVTLRNETDHTILLPRPGSNRLRFVNKTTLRESTSFVTALVSAFGWEGIVLKSGEAEAAELHVLFNNSGGADDSDESRIGGTLFDLPTGDYLAWFQLDMSRDYFCPNSHAGYSDLVKYAESIPATVWQGSIKSNRLHIRIASCHIKRPNDDRNSLIHQ